MPTPGPAVESPVRGQWSPTAASSRVRDQALSPSDRNYALWIHLSVLLGFLVVGPFAAVVPLILWLVRRDASPFLDDHGREVVNLSITGVGLFLVGLVTGIGILLWLVWCVVTAVNIVRGSIAASNGEYFRYPMTLRCLT